MSSLRSFVRGFATGSAFVGGALLGVIGTSFAAFSLGSALFSDVPAGSWFDAATGEMAARGIMTGIAPGKFAPNEYVTRAQLATVMLRFRQDLVGGGVSIVTSSSRSSSSRSSSVSSVSSVSSLSSTSTSSVWNTAGTLRFSTYAMTVSENAGKAYIDIVRVGGNQGSVTLNYATANGTAIAGTDYTAVQGTVTFAPKETSKRIDVPIVNNTLQQGHKNFSMNLSNLVGTATLDERGKTILITIQDMQDTNSVSSTSAQASSASVNPAGVLQFAVQSYLIPENAGSLTAKVIRTAGTTGTVSINYGAINGAAKAGIDFTNVSGTLTFNAGETEKTFSVPILDNTEINGNKIFGLVLSAPTGGATLGVDSTINVSTFDNEMGPFGSGSIKLSREKLSVARADGVARVTVIRGGGASGIVTVAYATVPSTASAGSDYTTTSGTLSFGPYESSKVITIPVFRRADAPTGLIFTLNLQSPSAGVDLVTPYSIEITLD